MCITSDGAATQHEALDLIRCIFIMTLLLSRRPPEGCEVLRSKFLCLLLMYLKNHVQILPEFSVYVACVHGKVVLGCTSVFVDEVIFAHNGEVHAM